LDGARDLGIADQVGSLEAGKRADIILVRATDLNMAPVVDPAFSLVYSGQPANVDTVIVDGRVLRRRGQWTACDPAQIVRDAAQSVRELAAR
uniref:amidohydrolase family protein n=1 Tax=Pigmentiphaga sp. TaxID=1977564 RepID=UPI0025FCBCEF